MAQELIILVVFILAAVYVVRLLVNQVRPKTGSGCAKGCGGGCSTIDFNKIQKELELKTTSAK